MQISSQINYCLNFCAFWVKDINKYNDVSNQQDATTFLFTNLFKSPYMFLATSSPILRSTFWLYIQLLVQRTDTAADRCHGWEGTGSSISTVALFDRVYSFWYNTTTLLPTGATVEMELEVPSQPLHFLTVYTAFGTTHRHCCRPVPRLRWNWKFHLHHGTGQQQCRCVVPKAVYTEKSAPEDGRICRPKHVGLI